MQQQTEQPEGDLLLRTLAMPADTNPNGDIFGGWIMSQMDIAGGILAKELAQGRVCTVSVNNITFYKPVKVGDVVCCYGRCIKIGRSSMQLELDIWIKPVLRESKNARFRASSGIFTYVAIDENGRPRPVPQNGAGA